MENVTRQGLRSGTRMAVAVAALLLTVVLNPLYTTSWLYGHILFDADYRLVQTCTVAIWLLTVGFIILCVRMMLRDYRRAGYIDAAKYVVAFVLAQWLFYLGYGIL